MKWIFRCTSVLGLLLILVSATPVLRWWTNALSADWGNETGDVLIVLGGEMVGSDSIGITSYWRCRSAVQEWREHRYKTIVITGKNIAPLMRDFIVSQGVPAELIVLEEAASTTRENALFVTRMLAGDARTKVLLTSDFHMGRALRAFRKAGLSVSPVPIPDVRKRSSDPVECWALFCGLTVETAKVVYYKARGWV